MTKLLIKNAKLQNQEGLKQILIENGQFQQILDNDIAVNHSGDILDCLLYTSPSPRDTA